MKNKIFKALILLILLPTIALANLPGGTDGLPSGQQLWLKVADAFRTIPDGQDIGTIADPVGDIFGGALTVTSFAATNPVSFASYLDIDEIATPANPSANVGRLFVADDSGRTNLHFLDAAGLDTNLSEMQFAALDGNTAGFTSIESGGEVTINGGDNTKFDIAAGNGKIWDFTIPSAPVITDVSWTAFTAESVPSISGDNFTSVMIDSVGALIKIGGDVLTPTQRRANIRLGALTHIAGTIIEDAVSNPIPSYNIAHGLMDYIGALGGVINGSSISTPNANLTFAQAAGTFTLPFINYAGDKTAPSTIVNSSGDPKSFNSIFQDGAGDFTETASSTNIDPDKYDVGTGSLASVPANKWTFQPVYFIGSLNRIIIPYGQFLYNSKSDAFRGINADFEEMVLSENLQAIDPLGFFVLQDGATDLTDETEAEYVAVFGTAGGGSVVVNEFLDSVFRIMNFTDSTKEMAFDVSAVTTATTRTYTAPDKDGTLALTSDIQSTLTFDYRASTIITAPPNSGQIRWDNATQTSAANLFVHGTTDAGSNVQPILRNLDIGTELYIFSDADIAQIQQWTIDSVTDNTTYTTYGVTLIDSNGSDFSNNQRIKFHVVGGGGGAMPSPLTTKGDVFTFTTVDARLPVGNNDEFLVANSAEATGLEWRDVSESTVIFSDDFETGSFVAGGWTTVNDGTNDWIVGSADAIVGSESAYISNNGTNATYTNNVSQVSHIYTPVVIPADSTGLTVDFVWRSQGEATFDYGTVWLTDTTFTPVAGTLPTEGSTVRRIGKVFYDEENTNQPESITIDAEDLADVIGTTQRLIFTWINDSNTGTNPPFIVDSVVVTEINSLPMESMISSAVRVYRSSSQSITTGVEAAVSFNIERYDIGGDYVAPTFTVPSSGFYNIQTCISLTMAATDVPRVRIYKNEIKIADGSDATAGASTVRPCASVTDLFAAGDEIEVRAFQTSGFTATLQGGEGDSFMSITKSGSL